MFEEMLEQLAGGLSRRDPNIINYRPNTTQEKFHTSDAVGRLLVGSNRSGKTVAGAAESVFRLAGRHPYQKVPEPPIKVRAITVDFNYGADEIIVPKLQQFIPPSQLVNGSWSDSYNKSKHTLRLANRSTLEIKSHSQDLDAFAGTPRHFLWVDEECPKRIFVESKARLVDYRGKYILTMTPVEGITWVYDDLVENANEQVEIFTINIKDNRFISKEAIEELKAGLGGDEDEIKIRIDGEFTPRGGKIFKNFVYDRHVVNEGLPPKDWPWHVSIDAGFNNPTAVYWHAVHPEGAVITFYEHYRREWSARMHAEEIHRINKQLGKEPDTYIGDPAMQQRSQTTGVSLITEYRNHGIPIIAGNNDVKAGIDRMNDYLDRDMWYITENCRWLLREIPKYQWAQFRSMRIADRSNRMEKPQKKDDHGCDSCRYFFNSQVDLRWESIRMMDPRMKILRSLGQSQFTPEFPWQVDTNLFSMARNSTPDLGWGEVP